MTDFNIIYYRGDLVVIADELIPETRAIINYANSNSYSLPTDIQPLNTLIINLKSLGLWDKADRLYVSVQGSGADMNFRTINLVTPGINDRSFFGGLTINSQGGIQSDGVNGYESIPVLYSSTPLEKMSPNDYGIILVSSMNSNAHTFYLGRLSVSTVTNFGVSNTANKRFFSSINRSYNMSGAGVKAVVTNEDGVRVYNNPNDFIDFEQTNYSNQYHNSFIFREGFTGANYRVGDEQFIYYGQGFSDIEYEAFIGIFNQYLSSLGFNEITY